MSETVTFSETPSLSSSPGQIVARIGTCSLGSPGTVYEFVAGGEGLVADGIGFGPLAALTRRGLRYGRQTTYASPAEVETEGTISAVTKDGGGPSITATALPAAGGSIEGPWFGMPNIVAEVSKAGALGTVRLELRLDGSTPGDELVDPPPQLPASIVGTVDLNTITLSSLNTLTVDLSDVDGSNPSAVTLTTPASVADLVAQIDAITGATASLVAGKYLKISGTTLGSTGSIANAAGTANTLLGLASGQHASGIDSTYDIPGLGVRLTFPAGTYEEGTTYSFATTSPRMSIAGMQAASAALRADLDKRFAILHIAQEPVDGTDLAAWQAALEDIRIAWATAEDNPVFIKWIIGSPLGTEGPDNWATNDQDVKTALTGTQAANKFNTIAHGDIFLEFSEYSGRHRASIAGPDVEKMARRPLSTNPGFPGPDRSGVLDGAYLKSVSGVKARTEAEALVKMESSGFTVLRNDGGDPFIKAGRTRAPSTSQLTGEHTARAALECGRVLRAVAFAFSNSTPPLGPDGQPRIGEKKTIESAFNDALQERLVKLGYCSAAKATIIAWVTTGGTDRAYVKAVFQRLANVEGVDVEIVVTDSLEIIEQSGV